MAIPLPSDYHPPAADHFAYNHPIRQGDSAAGDGEYDLVLNINWLHANLCPPIVNTVFRPDDGGGQHYLVGAGTSYGAAHAVWRRRIFRDLVSWHITASVHNTGTGSGHVKFELDSNGASVEIEVRDTTTQWTQVTGTLTINQSSTDQRDTIEMYIKNAASGAVRVHSVCIEPAPLTSISAGKTTEGFVPMESDDIAANKPLTVWDRQTEINNLEVLRKTRQDTIVGWSEDCTRAAASMLEDDSTGYVLVAAIPFTTTHGQHSLEWALFGHCAVAGSVKLVTVKGGSSEEITLSTGWSSPYGGSLHEDTDGGQSALACLEHDNEVLEVYVKGDGANDAFVMSLCVWFEDIA